MDLKTLSHFLFQKKPTKAPPPTKSGYLRLRPLPDPPKKQPRFPYKKRLLKIFLGIFLGVIKG